MSQAAASRGPEGARADGLARLSCRGMTKRFGGKLATDFGAQGGDWGYVITSALASHHPDRCVGIHLNFAMIIGKPSDPPTAAQAFALARAKHYQDWDSGYRLQQKTRPQTLGYGLADSPAAQAAWILEKLWSWTDNDGLPEDALSRDEMLDDITGSNNRPA